MTLDEFLDYPAFPFNHWIKFGTIESYLRKTIRVVNGQRVRSLDRANTSNHGTMRKGLYREWDTLLRQKAVEYGFDGVYVELVVNLWLRKVLPRYGYSPIPNIYGDTEVCFWWDARQVRTSTIIRSPTKSPTTDEGSSVGVTVGGVTSSGRPGI